MKLLEEFKKQLAELGDVRRVWLTTFSLNIDFVEKYLLPAILGIDPPRNRLDYEEIQQELVKQQIDVQLFVDQRLLTQASDRKRTSIPITGVAPQRFEYFTKASLFHPKVVYLESKDGRGIVGAGSANLTVDGWARNQEVFAFREVATDEQAAQIRSFFRPLFENCRGEAMPTISRKRLGKDRDWKFVHSLSGAPFPTELAATQEVTIMSPYFPHNLAEFLAATRRSLQNPDLVFHIVPDWVGGGKVRTLWTPELRREIEEGGVTFYRSSVASNGEVFQHAKVWATDAVVAVGSWNCTHPGSNVGRTADEWDVSNNIEAGFIFAKRNRVRELLGRPSSVTSANFSTVGEMDEEKLELPDSSPIDVRVRFDWRSQEYTIAMQWVDTPARGYRLVLPGVGEISIDHTQAEIASGPLFVVDPEPIVTNHFFQVFKDREQVLQGVIEETALERRRGECYQSLDDLLDSHLPEHVGAGTGTRRPRGATDDDGGEEEPVTAVAKSGAPTYFKVFYALHAFGAKLESCKTVDELERNVFTKPGGLKELQEKVVQLSAEKPATVHTWFVAHELNLLIKIAKKRLRQIPGGREDSKWKALRDEPVPRTAVRMNAACVEWIRRECQYV
jgi:hypothetical protein